MPSLTPFLHTLPPRKGTPRYAVLLWNSAALTKLCDWKMAGLVVKVVSSYALCEPSELVCCLKLRLVGCWPYCVVCGVRTTKKCQKLHG